MEGSLRYEATQPLGSETSPKVVHFSTPTNDHKLTEENESPKQNFPRNILSNLTFKRTKAPKKIIIAPPRQLPERKPLQMLTIADLSFSPMETSIEAQPYKWPHDGSLSPETTALVIIDMQKDCKLTFIIFNLRAYLIHPTFDS